MHVLPHVLLPQVLRVPEDASQEGIVGRVLCFEHKDGYPKLLEKAAAAAAGPTVVVVAGASTYASPATAKALLLPGSRVTAIATESQDLIEELSWAASAGGQAGCSSGSAPPLLVAPYDPRDTLQDIRLLKGWIFIQRKVWDAVFSNGAEDKALRFVAGLQRYLGVLEKQRSGPVEPPTPCKPPPNALRAHSSTGDATA